MWQLYCTVLHCTVLYYTHVDGAVVLVDLDAKLVAHRGEVVRLGQVAQAVVVHGILQITEYLLTWHPANIIEYYCKILSTSKKNEPSVSHLVFTIMEKAPSRCFHS